MRKTRAIAALVPALALLVTGLPASAAVAKDASISKSAESASSCSPPTGKVNITYWAWFAPLPSAIKLFNATHPNIHVTFDLVSLQDYQNLFNSLAAHKAPDVAQIEYSELPAFRLQNGLENIANCAPIKDLSSQFPSWTVNQVGVGTNAVYGVPQDIEPLALVYNKDIFMKYKLPVPTTWAEYKSDALKLKADDPLVKMTALTDEDGSLLTGLAWQAGARPYIYSGNSFTFDLDSPQMTMVANYWSGLVSAGVINTTAKPFTPAIYTAWDNGTVATMIVPAYMPDVMKDNAPKSSGDWAVAPLPEWTAGATIDGNDGGSATAVLAGTKYPYADAVFAEWLDENTSALRSYFGGTDPELAAANSYNSTSIVSTPYPYFGGQKVLEMFKQASTEVNENFQWAPNQTTVNDDLANNLISALAGTSTIGAAFQKTQQQAATNLQSLGVTVHTQ